MTVITNTNDDDDDDDDENYDFSTKQNWEIHIKNAPTPRIKQVSVCGFSTVVGVIEAAVSLAQAWAPGDIQQCVGVKKRVLSQTFKCNQRSPLIEGSRLLVTVAV